MTDTEDKAHRVLTDAWNYFWRHCADPSAYYEDYMTNEELDEVMAVVEKML